MAEVIHYALIAQAFVLVLMVLPALRRRPDTSTMLVIGGFVAYGAISFLWGAWALFGWEHPAAVLTWVVLIAFLFATLLPFFAMTPRRTFRKRDLPVLSLSGVALVGTIAVVVWNPSAFIAADDAFRVAAAEYVFGLLFIVLFVALLVLAVRWFRAPPGERRLQIGYLLPGVMLTNLNDGLGVARPSGLHLPGGYLVELAADPFIVATSVIRFLLIGAIMGVALVRYRRDRSADAGLILFWSVAAIPLAWVSMRVIEAHHIVDGLAFVLIYYGIARFRIIEVDLAAYLSAGKSLAAASAIVMVFIVQQAVEQASGTVFSIAGGSIVAGIALALLMPVQRWLEGGTGRPSMTATAAYDAHRRIEVYRSAMAAMVDKQQQISDRDHAVLERLRAGLDLTSADHDAILGEVRAASASTAPA